MLSNAIRGHMAEFGIIEAQGAHRVKGLLEAIEDDADARLPALARGILRLMAAQLNDPAARIGAIERQIMLWHKASASDLPHLFGPGTALVIHDTGVLASARM
jgi:transposase